MVLPDADEDPDGSDPGDQQAPRSAWSGRMPTSITGLAAGIVACIVVIAVCLAVISAALGLLVGG